MELLGPDLGDDFRATTGLLDGVTRTRPSEANDASFSDFFIFHFLATFSFFHSPRPSFLSSLFFLVQHCPNHLESVKVHFSAILTKALRTDQRKVGPTDKASYRDARAHLKIIRK